METDMGVTKSDMFLSMPRTRLSPHQITSSFAGTKIALPNGRRRRYAMGAHQLSASPRSSFLGPLRCSSSYTVSADSCHHDIDDEDFVDRLSSWNCIGSSHGWLGYVDPRNLSFYLFKPSLINEPCYLPYIILPPIQFVSEDPNVISKMAFSSSPSPIHRHSTNNTTNNNSSVLVVITLDWLDQLGPAAAFCRIGDPNWTTLVNFPGESCSNNSFQDITYDSKHKVFYVATESGKIYSWDLSNYQYCSINQQQQKYSKFRYLGAPPGAPPLKTFEELDPLALRIEREIDPCKYYLVMDLLSRSLIVIRLHISYGGDKKLYMYHIDRLDLDRLEWFTVKALVDTALFIGRNNGMALDVRRFPGLMMPGFVYIACTAANFFQLAALPVPCIYGFQNCAWDLLRAQITTRDHRITSFPVWNFE